MDETLLNPNFREALKFISEKQRHHMLLISGRCTIEYRGRAISTLPTGERLVIIKQDGCVIVHRGEGREPVNWMPPKTKTQYTLEEDTLYLHCERRHTREKMDILFTHINLLASISLHDGCQQNLTGLESDMVDQLEKQPHVLEEGLRILRREKQTRSGAIDLFAIDREGTPVIIEVKRNPPTPQAVYQLEAYLLDFKNKNPKAEVRGILCASKIPSMIRTLLASKGMEWREFTPQLQLQEQHQRRLDEFI
jgi:hypothetical protein